MQSPKFSLEEQARINELFRDIAAKRTGTSTEYSPLQLSPSSQLIQKIKDNPIVPIVPAKKFLLKHYAEPTTADMAVLMTYFNPANSVRILQNFLQVRYFLQKAAIPLYTAELAFNESPFLLKDATVQFRTTSYMFYKENLIKLLTATIPTTYTKLCILDADIMFEQAD